MTRSTQFQLRLTPDELAGLKRAAGDKPLSVFVRERLGLDTPEGSSERVAPQKPRGIVAGLNIPEMGA